MSLFNAIIVGLKEIWAHKFRSALTMLGIILGVSSLVAMSAMVQGMENGLRESLVAVGGLQKVRIEAQPVPIEQRHLRDFAPGITLRDVYALQQSCPDIGAISPDLRLERIPTLSANGKMYRTWMTAGVWPVQLEMMEHHIQYGRMFNELDEEQARNVCVIGTEVRNELFGKPSDTEPEIIPVGRNMNINGVPFTIIGMFEQYESEQDKRKREVEKAAKAEAAAVAAAKGITNAPPKVTRRKGYNRRGNFAFWIKNNTVYIPLNTMWLKLKAGATNSPTEPTLNSLEVKIKDLSKFDNALTEVRNVMLVRHRGIEDFTLRTQEEWSENIQRSVKNARMSGGFIAAIGLFVGGIGIMNIMLASISERVREIGIRKAVGAAGIDIFTQIIVESMVIALLGGLLGLVFSRVVVFAISYATPTDNPPIITLGAMAFAFAFSAVVGIVAGLIPALKASRMHVIQALRYD